MLNTNHPGGGFRRQPQNCGVSNQRAGGVVSQVFSIKAARTRRRAGIFARGNGAQGVARSGWRKKGPKARDINVCAPGFQCFSKFVKLPPVDAGKVTPNHPIRGAAGTCRSRCGGGVGLSNPGIQCQRRAGSPAGGDQVRRGRGSVPQWPRRRSCDLQLCDVVARGLVQRLSLQLR